VRKSDAFDRLFAQSIDEAFGELFGEGAKKALYRFLEHKYSIDLNAVSGSLDDFSSALQELFGVGGEDGGEAAHPPSLLQGRIGTGDKGSTTPAGCGDCEDLVPCEGALRRRLDGKARNSLHMFSITIL